MEDLEVHAPHLHKVGVRWWDMVVAGTAILVSMISLFVAIGNGQAMERLVAANSWPNVEVSTNVIPSPDGGGARFELALANTGVGPARVETLELWNGAAPIPDGYAIGKLVKENGDGAPFAADLGVTTIVGSVLGAGETSVPLSLETSDVEGWRVSMVKVAANIESRVCFCSVFEECRVADSRTGKGHAVKVKACRVPENPYSDEIPSILVAPPVAPG